MRGQLVDDRDPLQLIHIILGALQREDRVVKGILSIKALCMVDIPPPNTLHIFFSLISPTSHTMQLPRTTGVQAIFGLVTLFALVPQVSLALAMRKALNVIISDLILNRVVFSCQRVRQPRQMPPQASMVLWVEMAARVSLRAIPPRVPTYRSWKQ